MNGEHTKPATDQQLPDHTPDPWWIDDRRESGGALQIQARHRGEGSSYCVATVNHWDQPNANAGLIAAAPDLLASLRAVRDWMDNPELNAICPLDTATASAIRIAIAKAEGRSNG